jgi:hypothetical protein
MFRAGLRGCYTSRSVGWTVTRSNRQSKSVWEVGCATRRCLVTHSARQARLTALYSSLAAPSDSNKNDEEVDQASSSTSSSTLPFTPDDPQSLMQTTDVDPNDSEPSTESDSGVESLRTHYDLPSYLRPYQVQVIDACMKALDRGVRRMGVSSPTGSGKTVIL